MTKEEKAKQYARSIIDESVENYMGDEIFDSHIEYASQCYLAGYTQAEQDLSSQLTAYKEALRELVEHHERLKYINPRGMDKHVEYGIQLYKQAKQLLNNE